MSKTLAAILAGENAQAELKHLAWAEAVAKHADELARPRLYRVRLAVNIWSELVLEAAAPYEAGKAAEQRAAEATLRIQTAPSAFRWEVQKRVEPKNPASALEWVEVVYGPVDALDLSSPACWHLK